MEVKAGGTNRRGAEDAREGEMIAYLHSPVAIRERCGELFELVVAGRSRHFVLRFDAVGWGGGLCNVGDEEGIPITFANSVSQSLAAFRGWGCAKIN